LPPQNTPPFLVGYFGETLINYLTISKKRRE
jgi:hypothetical protein